MDENDQLWDKGVSTLCSMISRSVSQNAELNLTKSKTNFSSPEKSIK